ncbi:TonB domain protein [Pseudomonas syringae pv. delphinii]|uniref:TonB domain protein n=1 Tax=Pseudomonas syringae pv. delphinii TaxID=192088 RepID=A0A3M4AKR6_9PSED|nr:TonB domain protein [Pseudomonas syringae pv. delphinii]RMP16362.1 TonB domain protein [Pseudomonas syringae pv. delphinii]RMQ29943.1 TonB domain protein [Pseudomonas syringae pv. delphinii]
MRISAFMIAAALTLPVSAAESFLVPMHTPTPVFPAELIKTRYAGKVRAQLWIKSDGQVREVRAIESGHPQLTEAVEQTLRQWRYKPWIGTVGAPPLATITVPVIFGSHGYRRFNTEVTVGLGNIRCGYLNHEVKSARQDSPKEPLSKINVFSYTGQALFGSHAAQCQKNPTRRYVDYLPENVRNAL